MINLEQDDDELPGGQRLRPHKSLFWNILKTVLAVAVTTLVIGAAYLSYLNWSFGLDGDVAINGEIVKNTRLTGYAGKNPYQTALYFKKYLKEDEILLYDAFEYAYENPKDTIEIKKNYTGEQFNKVLYYLKCDSPMLTVNTIGTQTQLDSTDPLQHYVIKFDLKIPIVKSYQWTKIIVPKVESENTSKNLSEQTEQAAKRIIAAMPQYKTQLEKAQYIYRWLVTNVAYDSSGRIDEGSPVCTLFGALLDKRAQCDGFAAANMLMCNMVGIECFKVFYTGDDVNGDTGHTWNIAKLDGNYYNIDASGGENYTKQLAKWGKGVGAGSDLVSYEKFAMTAVETKYDSPVMNKIFNGIVPECTSTSPRQSLYSMVVTQKNIGSFVKDASKKLNTGKKGKGSFISVKFADKALCKSVSGRFDGDSGYGQAILKESTRAGSLAMHGDNDVIYLFMS